MGVKMDDEASHAARAQLVEGFAVKVGERVRRIYPSHAKVARDLGVPTSTVTRWAARHGIAEARNRLLRDEEAAARARASVPLNMDQLANAVVAAMMMRLEAKRPISTRVMDRLLGLLAWLAGLEPVRMKDAGKVEELLAYLLRPRA